MKPAKFEYFDPRSFEEATQLLDSAAGDGKVESGVREHFGRRRAGEPTAKDV